jgi:hypothetical protein
MRVGRFVNEVCLMYDVDVLVDLDGLHLTWNEGVALCDGYLGVKVALGVRNESATISKIMTPWFATEEELDEFCERHIGRFMFEAIMDEMPDATEWEAV